MSENRAAEMRLEFDASFQFEPRLARAAREELLVIRVGEQSYGVRLSQVVGVVKEKKITPLPGAPPELLGMAGFRGQLVAVFDLAGWLGQPRCEAGWLALVEAPHGTKIALAFAALERQLSLEPDELVASDASRHIDSLVQRPAGTLPVLSIPSLVERVAQSEEA